MYLWGEKKLKIDPGSYSPPYAARERSVITLIPSADISTPNSVIQDGGRERKTVSMSGFTNSLTEYNELHSEYLTGTVRTFTGPSGETLDGFIYELSAPKRAMYRKFEYTLTIMEA